MTRSSTLMPTTHCLSPSCIRFAVAAACALAVPVVALDGQPGMHDPSTVIVENGKYYVYATGGGLPMSISDDGWSWRRAGGVMQAVPGGKPGPDVIASGGNNTWAPDLIHLGDKYFLYYSAPGTQPKSAIGLLVGKTLDPESPDYKWEDAGPVVWSDGVEDSNAIDPGVFRDPTNGTLWLTYGSYFGYIRLVELNPKTGQAVVSRSEAGQHLDQFGSVDHDLPRRLVLPARHARVLLRRGELQLQHPDGAREEGDRAVSRQHGHRHAAGRRQAVPRIRRPLRRPRPFRAARSGGRRGEVLLPLRSRPRSRRHQRPRHPSAALARRLAGRRRERQGRHLRDRVGADGHRARAGRPGCAGRRARGRGGRGAPGQAVRPGAGAAAHPMRPAGGAGTRCGSCASAGADSAAGGVAGLGELAVRARRRAHGSLHAPGAAAVGDRAGRECGRLPRIAVLQDHDRRNGSHARGHGRIASWSSCRPSPARRSNCGASTSSPMAPIA